MNNLYTYTIELRDRLTAAVQKASGSVGAFAEKMKRVQAGVGGLNGSGLSEFSQKVGSAKSSVESSLDGVDRSVKKIQSSVAGLNGSGLSEFSQKVGLAKSSVDSSLDGVDRSVKKIQSSVTGLNGSGLSEFSQKVGSAKSSVDSSLEGVDRSVKKIQASVTGLNGSGLSEFSQKVGSAKSSVDSSLDGVDRSIKKIQASVTGLNGSGLSEFSQKVGSAKSSVDSSLEGVDRSVKKVKRSIYDLNNSPLSGLKNRFERLKQSLTKGFKDIPFVSLLTNPLVIAGAIGAKTLKVGMAQEMRNTSFEVLFKGKANAAEMINDVQQYAAKSPYKQADITADVQTMSGFGIKKEEIMPDIKAIGDIAMGQKDRMGALTLAFSQMSAAGRLMGQDLLQMVNAGFNPLKVISERTHQSMAVLRDEMSKGQISAKMVRDAFVSATSKGGQFYGMTKKISETIGGKWTTVVDNIEIALFKLYTALLPILKPIADGLIELAEIANEVFTKMSSKNSMLGVIFRKLGGIVIWLTQTVFGNLKQIISDTGGFVDKMAKKFDNLSIGAKILAGVIGYLAITIATIKLIIMATTIATTVYQGVVKVLTILKNAETLAWIKNTIAQLTNPVVWITAAIIALIAIIIFLIVKVDGWGKTWKNVMTMCGLIFKIFKNGLILDWLYIQDGFMKGIELIEKGWYKLQSLWDKDAANAGLKKLETERNDRATEIANTKGETEALKNELSNLKVWDLHWNKTSLSDVTNKLKKSVGMSSLVGSAGATDPTTGKGGDGDKGKDGKSGADTGAATSTANSIVTGGKKSTTINIEIGKMVESMNISAANIKESAERIREIVQDELVRAVHAATVNA